MKKLLKTLTLTLCIICIAFSTLIGCSFWEEIEMGYATQKPSITAKQTKKPSVSLAPSISSGFSGRPNPALSSTPTPDNTATAVPIPSLSSVVPTSIPKPTPLPKPFVFTTTVLLDNEYCKVEAIGFKENSKYNWGTKTGFELQLRMYNKTDDKNICIKSEDAHVNGIEYSTNWWLLSDLEFSSKIAPKKVI